MNDQVREILKPLEYAIEDVGREIEHCQSQGKPSLGKQICLNAMRKAYDQIAALLPKPLDVGEIVTFILAEFTSADFCGCYEGDSDEVFGDGVKGLAQAIAARFCAPDPAAVLREVREDINKITLCDKYPLSKALEIIDAKIKELEG